MVFPSSQFSRPLAPRVSFRAIPAAPPASGGGSSGFARGALWGLLFLVLALCGCASLGRQPLGPPTYVLMLGEEQIPIYVAPQDQRPMNAAEEAHWLGLIAASERRLAARSERRVVPEAELLGEKRRLNQLTEQTLHHYNGLPEAAEQGLARLTSRLDRVIALSRAPAYAAIIRQVQSAEESDGPVPFYRMVGGFNPIWPLLNFEVTSRFGYRRHPFSGRVSFHDGIDLAAPEGVPVMAAERGRVIFAGPKAASGNLVVLQHADGYETFYAHLQEVLTVAGVVVGRGQLVGFVGRTGQATGPHLHFKIAHLGSAVDPDKWIGLGSAH